MREIKFRVWNIDEYISLNKAIHDDIVLLIVIATHKLYTDSNETNDIVQMNIHRSE